MFNHVLQLCKRSIEVEVAQEESNRVLREINLLEAEADAEDTVRVIIETENDKLNQQFWAYAEEIKEYEKMDE